jgi:hypothetical protein
MLLLVGWDSDEMGTRSKTAFLKWAAWDHFFASCVLTLAAGSAAQGKDLAGGVVSSLTGCASNQEATVVMHTLHIALWQSLAKGG